jgi:hypothetical protein
VLNEQWICFVATIRLFKSIRQRSQGRQGPSTHQRGIGIVSTPSRPDAVVGGLNDAPQKELDPAFPV